MCNCDKGDTAEASYFTHDATLKLGYSYDACETSTGTTHEYLTKFCTDDAPPFCPSNSCKKSNASDPNTTCVPETSSEILNKVGCLGKTGCKCINPVELKCVKADEDNKVTFTTPTSTVCKVPKQYGTGCSAWDTAEGMEFYSDCVADEESWCTSPWCYIDMCDCDASDLAASTYFEPDSGLKLGYSYQTCNGKAESTSDYLTTFCSEKKEEDACTESPVCKWASACAKKTSAEIKKQMKCPTPATPQACPATANLPETTCARPTPAPDETNSSNSSSAPAPASTTTSGSDRQRLPSFIAAVTAVTTFVFAAWGQ